VRRGQGNQFAAELEASGTDAEERLFALKFLLHFVGDMHQPLHASDNRDGGGNSVKVTVEGFDHKSRDNLHGFWDTQFVDALGMPPAALANKLLAKITREQEAEWKQGTPDNWAMEAFNTSFDDAYGQPPLPGAVHLDAAYVTRAEKLLPCSSPMIGRTIPGCLRDLRTRPELNAVMPLRVQPSRYLPR
jgi:hypothetical protein